MTEDDSQILDLIWPLLSNHTQTGLFLKINQPDVLVEIGHGWIDGKPFCDLLRIIKSHGAKMISRRKIDIYHVVGFCEGTLAYDGSLLISALIEFVGLLIDDESEELSRRLERFQKCLKYGLPTEPSVVLYELGFSDRVIAQDIQMSLGIHFTDRTHVIRALRKNEELLTETLDKYPSYYHKRAKDILFKEKT